MVCEVLLIFQILISIFEATLLSYRMGEEHISFLFAADSAYHMLFLPHILFLYLYTEENFQLGKVLS